jgi:alkanesulfonate monooxygenase SsuD/methylene tetrahydromethanopterin reductase-like flavin-dependent oxidoreductase (luciferase family)
VRLGLAGWQREAASRDANELLAIMQHADELGFESVWFNELHFHREDLPYPSATLLAAAILARTERLRVGLSVVVLPIHHPLLLAEELSQLDNQGGGRLDVGIGRGFPAGMDRVFPMSDAERRGRFEEAFAVLTAAWSGATISSPGPYWPFSPVQIGPSVYQQPHPPLYLAGTSLETMRFAVQHDLPMLLSLEPPETTQLQNLALAGEEFGTVPNLAHTSLARYVCVAPTRTEALAQADELRLRLHERRRAFARLRGDDPEALVLRSESEFIRTQTIVGSPDDCIRQIHQIVADLGIGHIRCTFNGTGTVDPVTTLRGMDLFAREVLPIIHNDTSSEVSTSQDRGAHSHD